MAITAPPWSISCDQATTPIARKTPSIETQSQYLGLADLSAPKSQSIPINLFTPGRGAATSVTCHHPTYQIIGSFPSSSFRRKTRLVFSSTDTSLFGSFKSPNFLAPTGQISVQ